VKPVFFTIGHSDRSVEDVADMLRDAGVEHVVDVRAFPRSRSHPQFNIDVLPDSLTAFGLSYEHVASLGGRRGKSRTVPADVNGYWTHQSFHNYADYALSDDFTTGLEHLLAEGRKQRCVIMCSEAVWWRCHRRIITDYLLARGETVMHILGPGRRDEASLTPGASVQPDGTVFYPA
jgi:uncharacterized protein (DUF488 family)